MDVINLYQFGLTILHYSITSQKKCFHYNLLNYHYIIVVKTS